MSGQLDRPRTTYEQAIQGFCDKHGYERDRVIPIDNARCLTYAEHPIPRAQFRDDIVPKVRTKKIAALISGRYVQLDARR